MMNKLQEAIAKLEAETDRNELNEKLLQMLQEKERELGENLSEEEAEQATAFLSSKISLSTSVNTNLSIFSPSLPATNHSQT